MKIVVAYRLESEPAKPWDRKDRLGNDCAGNKRSQQERGEGQRRYQGVAEAVLPYDLGAGNTLGPGQLYELGVEYLEHCRPDQAQIACSGDPT